MGWNGNDDRSGESIIVVDGKLVFDRGYPTSGASVNPPVRVFKGQYVRVGCHRLTTEAWEQLKKEVDGD